MVGDTRFSVDRGFFDAPFQLTISTNTPGAQDPLHDAMAACPRRQRARLHRPDHDRPDDARSARSPCKPAAVPSNVDTQTYIFLNDVVTQSFQSTIDAGFPTVWSTTAPDYGMDTDVIGPERPVRRGLRRLDQERPEGHSHGVDRDEHAGHVRAERHLQQSDVERRRLGAGQLRSNTSCPTAARVSDRRGNSDSRRRVSQLTRSPRRSRSASTSRSSTARRGSSIRCSATGGRRIRQLHPARREQRRLAVELAPAAGRFTRATNGRRARNWRWASRPCTATTSTCTSTAFTGACTTWSSGPTTRFPRIISAARTRSGTRSTPARRSRAT